VAALKAHGSYLFGLALIPDVAGVPMSARGERGLLRAVLNAALGAFQFVFIFHSSLVLHRFGELSASIRGLG
jgi:hypothetical protein